MIEKKITDYKADSGGGKITIKPIKKNKTKHKIFYSDFFSLIIGIFTMIMSVFLIIVSLYCLAIMGLIIGTMNLWYFWRSLK